MNANHYQKMAHMFASPGLHDMYPFLGLFEEAGEVAGKMAKFVRENRAEPFPPRKAFHYCKKHGTNAFAKDIKFAHDLSCELGDVLWMVSECATRYGLKLDRIMARNIAKLTDRLERNVIVGEGDNR